MSGDEVIIKKRQKSRIEGMVLTRSIMILSVVLFVITTTVVTMVSGIASKASIELARLYSLEAVGRFNLFINQDLVLMRKVAASAAVSAWFADETNENKRSLAYEDMMGFINILRSARLYFVINNSLDEYSINYGASREDFIPFDRIDPNDPYNDWYFNCVNADTDYTLVIDVDKVTGLRHLWINHKVKLGRDIVGVFCSGLPFDDIARDLFAHYDIRNVKGYIIDRDTIVKMESTLSDSLHLEGSGRFHELSSDSQFRSAIDAYFEDLSGHFLEDKNPVLLRLQDGSRRYVSIAPITGTDWLAVIFFNSASLFGESRLLPLVFSMLSAFIIYAFAAGLMMRRLVLTPLDLLTESVVAAESGSGKIFGQKRDDEIGELARKIQHMHDSLSAYTMRLIGAATERERLIRTDELTNIANRRCFDERLPLEWERAAQTQSPLSLLMIDIDFFKKFNDSYGHLEGDKALQAVARIAANELFRPADLVARWGGEEFACILPDTHVDGALIVAERMRQRVEANDIPLASGEKTKITISIGVNSVIPSLVKPESADAFLSNTDKALYAAKGSGRNKVCRYE